MSAMSSYFCDNQTCHTYVQKPQQARCSHQLEQPGQSLAPLPLRSVSLGLSCSEKKAGNQNKICKKDAWMSETL